MKTGDGSLHPPSPILFLESYIDLQAFIPVTPNLIHYHKIFRPLLMTYPTNHSANFAHLINDISGRTGGIQGAPFVAQTPVPFLLCTLF
jgi:hypothetical protein